MWLNEYLDKRYLTLHNPSCQNVYNKTINRLMMLIFFATLTSLHDENESLLQSLYAARLNCLIIFYGTEGTKLVWAQNRERCAWLWSIAFSSKYIIIQNTAVVSFSSSCLSYLRYVYCVNYCYIIKAINVILQQWKSTHDRYLSF